ncbi:MAG TPA: peptidylprolyl isomerase [Pyrinomonadaceae bacterium]|nr:peptidylprolyl isomerase [Pyrinomonadaceae bacterium]
MRTARHFINALLLAAACLGAAAHAQEQKTEAPSKQETAPASMAPKQEAPPAKKNARPEGEQPGPAEPFDHATPAEMSAQCVTLDTEAGAIVVEMLAEAAPESARNFLNLAAEGAFDTTTFSRVVKDFVIQGGNITTRETVPPELLHRASRKVPDEPNAVKHLRGVVSLARPAEANAATTHFFILLNDAPHLDGTFAAFGRVTSGMDVVDKIAAGELDGEKPKHPVRVRRFTVARCQTPERPKQ